MPLSCEKKSLSPDSCSGQQSKRIKYDLENGVKEIAKPTSSSQSSAELLSLSDDVLLLIMVNLGSQDLLHLSQTCQRLEVVTRDHTLWTSVDLRPHHLMLCQLWEYVSFLQATTRSIALRGLVNSTCSRPGKLFSKLAEKCPDLETLIAEEYSLDTIQVPLTTFPATLKHFALKSCRMHLLPREHSYFRGIHKHMPLLEVLVLEDNLWLTAHSFMAMSKCVNLRELRVKGCRNLGSCVAYTSIAARFGFKALEVLDIRQTLLCDSEISCFNQTQTLTHLYLECATVRTDATVQEQSAEQCSCQCSVEDIMSLTSSSVPHCSNIIQPEDTNEITEEDVPTLISDVGIASLGHRDLPGVERGLIVLFVVNPPMTHNPNLYHLVIRNYKAVGDLSLLHLSRVSSLRYLDVTGTSVTLDGVTLFMNDRADVTLVSDFTNLT